MANCCNNPVCLGCVGHCNPSPVIEAKQTGNHTVKFDFLDASYFFIVFQNVGEVFVFPNIFNEDSIVNFQIVQPDGSNLSYTVVELAALGIITTQTGPFECFALDIKPMRILSGSVEAVVAPSCIMKLTPVGPERFATVIGDNITVTAFSIADTVSFEVFLDGRLVSEVAGDEDTIGYSIAAQIVTFSEDITGSEVVVKGIIETEFICP